MLVLGIFTDSVYYNRRLALLLIISILAFHSGKAKKENLNVRICTAANCKLSVLWLLEYIDEIIDDILTTLSFFV